MQTFSLTENYAIIGYDVFRTYLIALSILIKLNHCLKNLERKETKIIYSSYIQ